MKTSAKAPTKVEDLISRHMITAEAHDTKAELEKRMASRKVHALPIVDEEGRAVGLVTGTDLEPDLPDDTPVGDIMTEQVYTVEVGTEAAEAARMMLDLGVHHLVATEGGRAVGVLSSFDLLTLVADL